MKRFVIKFILISLGATVVWSLTTGWTRPTTIYGAKALHALVGYPAPWLLADLDHYHWFAPLFPPLVGLVMASQWVSWRRRLGGLVIGLAAFWYLVALQIAIVYSPYLTLSAVRAYLMSVQITLNSVVVPVVLWLIATGGPPREWSAAAAPDQRPQPPADADSAARWGVMGVWTLLFSAILTLPILAAGAQTDASITAARNTVARAITADNPVAALRAIDTMFTRQQSNAALSYLQMELHRQLGQREEAERIMDAALTTPQRRRAYRNRSR